MPVKNMVVKTETVERRVRRRKKELRDAFESASGIPVDMRPQYSNGTKYSVRARKKGN